MALEIELRAPAFKGCVCSSHCTHPEPKYLFLNLSVLSLTILTQIWMPEQIIDSDFSREYYLIVIVFDHIQESWICTHGYFMAGLMRPYQVLGTESWLQDSLQGKCLNNVTIIFST